MHEHSLISDLVRKITSVARLHDGARIVGVTVRLGALSHISASHFREHFVRETVGTLAEDARLTVIESTDIDPQHGQDVMLESVEMTE
jgi:hydrogenase nickel incorporation protein HypA/HybF